MAPSPAPQDRGARDRWDRCGGPGARAEPAQSGPALVGRQLTPEEPHPCGIPGDTDREVTGTAPVTSGQQAGSLLSVNVGLPQDVTWHGRTVRTAVWKKPVTGPRMVRR